MPRAPRFFVSPDQVVGSGITLTGEDVRHIATVLRMKPGEHLLLCDGQGAEYLTRIVSLDRASVATEIVSTANRPLTSPRITLCQGIPKFDKMDFIVQKATELGVAAILPVVTERTIVKLKDEEKRIARWQKICREAAMQSNRGDIPRVEQVRTFSVLLAESNPPMPLFEKEGEMPARPPSYEPSGETLLLLPWEEGTEPIKSVLRSVGRPKGIVVIIGPEGGLSANEAALAKDKEFHLVSLGRNILRTETAALAVLSMLQYEFME